jgi:hypothetical protein
MPKCSYCGWDLPGFDSICPKCFDARYADINRRKSLLEIVTNPLGLTEEELRQARERPLPLCRKMLIFLFAFAFFFFYGLFRIHLVVGHTPAPKTWVLFALLFASIVVYVESRGRR